MYTALYRSQRPEVFDEIIGQDHIVRILKNQVRTDTVSHAYLFCGTRGTGKTTTARILAKAVNCLEPEEAPCGHCANCEAIREGTFLDVIEIDAASNNGVDNIRELRESVKYPPAVGRKKVYIIDEVHMLSTGASNALLKTLEEPPEHVMFILATTDPQRLPQTILSRCMRLDFRRVPEPVLAAHMGRICAARGIEVTEDALRLLAANADGSVRDGLSILEQCLSAGDPRLDRDLVLEFLGAVSAGFFLELTDRVAVRDVAGALVLLDSALQDGKDVKQMMRDWMSHYRSLLITKYIRNAEDMLNLSMEQIGQLRAQSNQISLDEIEHAILTLARTIQDARYSTQPRILLELAIVTIATGATEGAPSGAAGAMPERRAKATPRMASVRPAAAPATSAAGAAAAANPATGTAAAANPATLATPATGPASSTTPAAMTSGSRGPAAGACTTPDPSEMSGSATPATPVTPATDAAERAAQTAAAAQTTVTPPAPPRPEPVSQEDLEELWGRIFEAGEDVRGSFNLIRTGATLTGLSETEFRVQAHSDFVKSYLQSNQEQICDLMEQVSGRRRKMVIRTDEPEEADRSAQDREMEEAAGQLRANFGLDVTLK